MNNHPVNIDVSFLKEKTLIQICIGQNEIVLNFQGDTYHKASITVESDISVTDEADDTQTFEDTDATCLAASAMARFLGKDIKEAVYKKDGSLMLIFPNGGRILLHNNEEYYVSYTIHYQDQNILI